MTQPTSLVVGRWESARGGGVRRRTLSYAGIEGAELKNPSGYIASTQDPIVASPSFRYSYQAHVWFIERAKMLIEKQLVEKAQKENLL